MGRLHDAVYVPNPTILARITQYARNKTPLPLSRKPKQSEAPRYKLNAFDILDMLGKIKTTCEREMIDAGHRGDFIAAHERRIEARCIQKLQKTLAHYIWRGKK